MIYHIVSKHNWNEAQRQDFYEADSLAAEGFIHCSDAEQVAGVLERYYKDQTGLLLLHIDETKLIPTLTYELAPSINEEFPHIYGRLNLDAVVKTTEL